MTDSSHWERVYREKSATGVSWYQPHLKQSLQMIAESELPTTASIVDVGGGASTQRIAYVEQVERCVRPGKFVMLSTFAPDGPEHCSGLAVARYSPDELADALGPAFEKLAEAREHHTAPSGAGQSFSYVLCRRR